MSGPFYKNIIAVVKLGNFLKKYIELENCHWPTGQIPALKSMSPTQLDKAYFSSIIPLKCFNIKLLTKKHFLQRPVCWT